MNGVKYGEMFVVEFMPGRKPSNKVDFTAYAPPFATHSISMNQRMLRLNCNSIARAKNGSMSAVVEAPPSSNVAPSGYYLITVVNGEIPSISRWVRFLHA